MSRRRPRTLTKAATPLAPAATFTAEQMLALAAATATAKQTTGAMNPLPRTEPQVAFGPGLPLIPGAIDPLRPDTYRPEPRRNEYPVSANLPGSTDRLVPWSVLRDAADRIGLFRRCIEIRKNEVATLEWAITISKTAVETAQAANPSASRADVEADLRDKLGPEIVRCTSFWEEPDRGQGYQFDTWSSALLEDHLVLDAVALYPRMDRRGNLYALENIDGSTIKILRDYRGGRPLPPAPAYQQILHGFPRGEFVADVDPDGAVLGGYGADELIYRRRNVRSNTVYGYSAVEQALSDGDLYLRRHQWMRSEYTEGTMPTGWLRMLADTGWTPQQVREYERDVNDTYGGSNAERHRLRVLPFGLEPEGHTDVAERYRPEYDLFLIELVASHFDVTIAELGFSKASGLGSTGWHEGQESVQDRKATQPTLRWLQAMLTDISRRHLRMPAELEFRFLGLEAEDEAAADSVAQERVTNGRMTLNEDRDRLGLPRFDFDEADMPMLLTHRGVVFLEGAAAAATPGTLLGPGAPAGPAGPAGASSVATPGTEPAADVDEEDDEDGDGESPANPDAMKAELAAYRRWSAKRATPGRRFTFSTLTKADAAAAGVDLSRAEFAGGGAGPKGGSRPWPGWVKDQAAARHWAPVLSRASSGALADLSKADAADRVVVAQRLHEHRDELAAAIALVLAAMWTDGLLIGALSARGMLAAQAAASSNASVDWLGWSPGDTDRARRILTTLGLAEVLAGLLAQAPGVAGGIADTRLNVAARRIADSDGEDEQDLVDDVLGDPNWAYLVGITEVTRASVVAALATYRDAAVEAVEWCTQADQRVCGACFDNGDAGPVPVGAVFPSGDDAPPAHPGCRCNLAPATLTRAEAFDLL